jgi:hypothetical protein
MWAKTRAETLHSSLQFKPAKFWKLFNKGESQQVFGIDQWTQYFSKLFAGSSDEGSIGIHMQQNEAHIQLFPGPDPLRLQSAEALNAPITLVEVEHALHVSQNGKAHGYDGLPAEFIKDATFDVLLHGKFIKHYALADHLVHLFNHVFREGYPSTWATGTYASTGA